MTENIRLLTVRDGRKKEDAPMFYITGDTHGDFRRYYDFMAQQKPTEQDTMIVLGDAGLNFYGNEIDERKKDFVNSFSFTTFCVHGNHEMRPANIPTYKTREYCGGIVWYEEQYPRILFAKDGEVYHFEEYTCIVIGGAYSVDKYYRLAYELPWFADEQPSEEIKAYTEAQLARLGNQLDIVLSHTCPISYEPTETFIPGLNQALIDKSTEQWLGVIEEKIHYKRWYCGHYHTIKKIDNMRFLYENICQLGE